jgi:hypothetical protein
MRGSPIPRIDVAAMSYRLAPHRHVVAIDRRLIVLDVAKDRYLGLGPPASDALAALARQDFSHPGIRQLLSLGIVESGEWRRPYLEAAHPTKSALECEPEPSMSPAFLDVAGGILRCLSELRWRGLSWKLDAFDRAAKRLAPGDQTAIGLAQRFAQHRSRLPFKNICLAESFALHAILNRHGYGADLVIGVRLNPFGAHCWLQQEDCVLNDNCDHISQFTPILIA